MTCNCGHWHGSFPCTACACKRFRVSSGRRDARNINGGGTAFVSPLFHLTAFSLQNPMVQWCIEKGVYFDVEDRPPCDQDVETGAQVALELGIPVSPRRQLR